MGEELKNAMDRLTEIKALLLDFSSRDEAIQYLVTQTKLTQEECSAAYDFFMKLAV